MSDKTAETINKLAAERAQLAEERDRCADKAVAWLITWTDGQANPPDCNSLRAAMGAEERAKNEGGVDHPCVGCIPPNATTCGTLARCPKPRPDATALREALEKLRAFARSFDCDYQEECTPGCDDACPSCKAVYIADGALALLRSSPAGKESPDAGSPVGPTCAATCATLREFYRGWTWDLCC